MLYKHVIRPILFLQGPEEAHNTFLSRAKTIQKSITMLRMMRKVLGVRSKRLVSVVDGIRHENPIGLAAGFDKNCEVAPFMEALGFGHLELGSVTLHPHGGNPKPRLQRLPKEKSMVVNYGLANDGAGRIIKRLSNIDIRIPYGVSVAKTPSAKGKDGIEDYAMSFGMLHDFGSYTTINISCPNVADGQTYGEDPKLLDALLDRVSHSDPHKPVYLKLKPDYTTKQVDAILGIVAKYPWVKGVIVSNLTKSRKDVSSDVDIPGGIGGALTRDRSTELIRHVFQKTRGQLTIIGCGGVFTAKHAYDKIRAGATLIQLITGMIYEGPFAIKRINRGLVRLMRKDGFSHISEAIGADA